MQNKKIQKLIFLFLLLFFLLGANFVFALEITYPRVPGAAPPQDFLNDPSVFSEDILSLYAKYLVNLCIWTGGILALAGLIYGGVLYLISTGKPDRMALAKSQITAAFFGLLLLLSSFLILKTLSPQFTELKLEPLKPVEIEGLPEITPVTASVDTRIDPESSPGRIIEKIFETYISEYPEPDQKWTPRIMRLKNNTKATKEIVGRLVNQSKTLRDAADACRCENTYPDPRCNHHGCHNCPPDECTCNPCKNVRSTIQSTEQKNLNEIYIGDGVTVSEQMNVDWQLETIPSTLIKEMLKTEDEVRLLKEQLNRLKRAEKYIQECPSISIYGYIQFMQMKDRIENSKGTVRQIDFWNDVNMTYYRPKEKLPRYNPIPYKEKEYVFDYATFYCDVSGTLQQKYPFPSLSTPLEKFTGEENEKELEELLSESLACPKEAPFGELSDRVKRITQLLIDKFEEIVELDKKLIKKIDELQRAISECTSKRCIPQCICISCGHHCEYCVEIGCFGEPCPMNKINDKFNDIKEIQDEIGFLIDGRGGAVTPKNIGIITLIDEYVPQILEELEVLIRHPMKTCSLESLEKRGGTMLFTCSYAKGATTPGGKVILYCCQTESQQPYSNCFEKCYLEKKYEEHRECVNLCLVEKAIGLNDEKLPKCIHHLNFYCCYASEGK